MIPERHVLKVQDSGDHYHKEVKPQIRLEGKWLVKAGLVPEDKVEVLNPQPGMLILRIVRTQDESTRTVCKGCPLSYEMEDVMVSQAIDLRVQTKIDSAVPDTRTHGRIITTKVVGVTFENRQEVVARLQMGDRVWLEREPFNAYDTNAIKVICNNGEQIGYINRQLARSIASLMDRKNSPVRGKVYLLTGSSYEDYTLGVIVAFKFPKAHQHDHTDLFNEFDD